MLFLRRNFPFSSITLYPLGDIHYGSPQCDVKFVEKLVEIIRKDSTGFWVGMGDMIENAMIGTLGDIYRQKFSPQEQCEYIVSLLKPIKDKGLFIVTGNHELRSARHAGLEPDRFVANLLGVPYAGPSCLSKLFLKHKSRVSSFDCFVHHGAGGGRTQGGKVNASARLRDIVPTADLTLSGHSHTTGRIPVMWREAGLKKIINRMGYNYITGSALSYDCSYAEEKALPPAINEFISITLHGRTRGDVDDKWQEYKIISPDTEV